MKDNIIFTNACNLYSCETTERLCFRPLTHERYITSGRISDTILYLQRTDRFARNGSDSEEEEGTRGQIRAFDRNLDFVSAIEGQCGIEVVYKVYATKRVSRIVRTRCINVCMYTCDYRRKDR